MTESLTLKWGTLKAWDLKTESSKAVLKEYIEIGSSMSAMAQEDTPAQKHLICKLIDVLDAETIYMDWTGEYVTKEEAKEYILNYR
jgi:hypothetical protein